MSIESRVERIEKALGLAEEDELIEIDVGDGKPLVMTNREFDELLREIEGTRLLPKDDPPRAEPRG